MCFWENPDVDAWLPCQRVVEDAPVPVELCTETVFKTKKHETYRRWMAAKGRASRGLPTRRPPPR